MGDGRESLRTSKPKRWLLAAFFFFKTESANNAPRNRRYIPASLHDKNEGNVKYPEKVIKTRNASCTNSSN